MVMPLFEKLRKYLFYPLARYHWLAAERSRASERWEDLAEHIETIHALGWKDDSSRYLLGLARTSLGEHERAIHEFSEIRGRIEPESCEQGRWLNMAVSLNHVGRLNEALRVLDSHIEFERLDPTFRARAEELHDNIIRRISTG